MRNKNVGEMMKAQLVVFGNINNDGRAMRMQYALMMYYKVVVSSSYSNNKISFFNFEVERNRYLRHIIIFLKSVKIALREKPDLIVAENFYSLFSAVFIGKILHIPIVYDAYELIIPGSFIYFSLRDKFWYWIERCCIRYVDLVIAANSYREKKMKDHYILTNTISVSNFTDPSKWKYNREYENIPILNNKNEYKIIYQGDICIERGIIRFIDSMRYLDNTRLLLVGSGIDEESIRIHIIANGLEKKVTLLGFVPTNNLHQVTKKCHIGIICYPYKGLNNIFCAPNKIFEYAQSGLPVLSTNQPPLENWISKYKIGKTLPEEYSARQIAEIIKNMLRENKDYKAEISNFLKNENNINEKERLIFEIEKLNKRNFIING